MADGGAIVKPRTRARARVLRVADLFCGAGGSSTGAERALARLGHRMDLLCVNHWDKAIATHRRNHPKAHHICQDVGTVRPLAVVPKGKLDLLMASPTCTHHSRARGGRPTSDQQRMDPWHVITWLTQLRVRCLIIENVPEFVQWGPVDLRSGRPVRSRRGEYFQQWLTTIRGLGFVLEWKILNCADFGDATTRERFFMLARSDGQELRWPRPTHRRRGLADGSLFSDDRPQWRAARDIIDWSLEGTSIYARKRPLAIKTLRRIEAGMVKFGWPEPFLIVLRQHMGARSVADPVPTISARGTHVGIVRPFLMPQRSDNDPSRTVDDPAPTITSVSRIGVVEPFVFPANQSSERKRGLRTIGEPLCTITATGTDLGIVQPYMLSQGAGGAPRGVGDPVPTIPGGGAHALVAPYYGEGSGKSCVSADDPLPTCTAKGRFGLVVPVTHQCSGDRARSVDDPLPTITTAKRGELSFITAQFGERPTQSPRVHGLEQPTPTICGQGRVNLVEPGGPWDVRFRMLQPHELAAAMGFNSAEARYEFVGTKTDQIKQIGNAVPVNTASALVGALFEGA